MDNIDLTLDEISPIEDINISDNSKLQDVSLGFGEVIYVDNGVKDHEKLNNLDYENSGHTGFASSEALSNVDKRVKSLEEIGIPEDGLTPYIGENGNWFIGEEDTGVQAEGQDGKDGTNGVDGVGLATITQGETYESNGYTVTPITFTKTDDTFHTFGIKAKDGKSENLELYATNEYVNELDNANKDSIQGINDKIGAVEENKTVVEMIADAQAEATYDDTALSNRVTNLENNSATHEEVAGVKSDLDNYKEDNDKAVKSNSDAISVLNGNSITEGSVDYKVNKAINEFAQAVTSNDTIDTFAEVISYVATHGEEFSELVGEVDKNTKSVETLNGADNVVGSVDYKIKSAIANENLSQYATDSELKGVSDRVKAIESDYATDTDFTNLNHQVQGMYTNAQIDSAVSNAQSTANSYTDSKIEVVNKALDGKQPSGDYALNSDIPTKVSELENDSGFITSVPVASVNGATGDVTLADLGLNNDKVQIGSGATASGSEGIAIGRNASATMPSSLAVGLVATGTGERSVALGHGAEASALYSTAVGNNARARGQSNTAIGSGATVDSTARNAVQIGSGTNSTDNTLQFRSYQLLDVNGKIPNDRLPTGLATETYVDTKVANLVNSAPETLNTLGELATAIQNHEDEYDALLETIGNKANKSDLDSYLLKSGGTITGSSGDTPLYLKSAHANGSYEGFQNAGGATLGYLGYSSKDTPAVYLSSGAKTIYHEGNLTKTSQLTNDSGFLTSAPVTSVNGQTGAVELPFDIASKYTYVGSGAGGSDSNAISIGNSTADGNNSTAIGYSGYAEPEGSIAIGYEAYVEGSADYGVAIGDGATVSDSANSSVALGSSSTVTRPNAVQLGEGTNSTEGTLQFRDYQLLNENGQVPAERTLEGIAIDFNSANMTVSKCDANGISIAMPEIEFDAGDGGLAYGKGNMTLPIVAGNGINISLDQSDSLAYISSKGMLCITISNTSSTSTYCELQFQIPNTIGITTRETKQPISRVLEALKSAYDIAMIPCTGFFYASSAYCFATSIALSSTSTAVAGYKFSTSSSKPTSVSFTAGLSGAICTLTPSL